MCRSERTPAARELAARLRRTLQRVGHLLELHPEDVV
jgi:hypothetical protein